MNAYGHQTFQGGDKPCGDPTHKLFGQLNGKVLWVHVTNKLHVSSSEINVLTCRFPVGNFQKINQNHITSWACNSCFTHSFHMK